MAVFVSTINLKGGVGKTQMTVALAEFLALEHHKKVLVIDLDAQTNATVSLIAEEAWLEKDRRKETLAQLFLDKLENTSCFDIRRAIVKKVSNVGGGIENLDLLPSSPRLLEIQDSLAFVPVGRFFVANPVTILKNAVYDLLDEYDFVLIDCPPYLGITTLNGIYISNYYLIPCIPDILSTYGIPLILDRIKKFIEATRWNIRPLGIVISMYRAQSRLHSTMIQDLQNRSQLPESDPRWTPRIFNTKIPLAAKSAEAAEFSVSVNTLKQKYGYGNLYEQYKNLTEEFLSYVE
ncbi:MAG: AAA family ATPase [Firmicutes bacterium]|nr:AAA family ATPase [Bacillota bacterium]